MTKCYFDSIDKVKSEYPDYYSLNGGKTTVHNGLTYVKIGKTTHSEKLSLYLLKDQFLSPIKEVEEFLFSQKNDIPFLEGKQLASHKKSIENHLEELKKKKAQLTSNDNEQERTEEFEKLEKKILEYQEFEKSITLKINEFIFQKQLPLFKNLEVSNPRLLIFLLGTYCMGKSTISNALEEHLQAVHINCDHSRNIISQNEIPQDMLDQYLEFTIKKLQKISPNGLVVLDKCIGRNTYARYLGFSQIYMIRLSVPRSVVEERISKRNHIIHNTTYFLENLNRSWSEYESFAKDHKFDFVLDNSSNDNRVPTELIKSIKSVLN